MSSCSTGETARLEMFSDGVFAIAITLLSLGLAVPALASMILNCALAAFFALPAFALPDAVPGSSQIDDDEPPASG